MPQPSPGREGSTKSGGGDGFADVWKRNHFGMRGAGATTSACRVTSPSCDILLIDSDTTMPLRQMTAA
jgi:hypothetical protein